MEVKIEKLDNELRGICYVNGKITFVSKALPNEEVIIDLVEKHSKYNIGKLIKIIKPSTKRRNSFCPFNKYCGSCTLSILDYDDTISLKKERLKDILKGYIDKDIQVISSPKDKYYRNKITIHIRNGIAGYFIENTNTVIKVDNCMIASPGINAFLSILPTLNIKNADIVIRDNYKNELLIAINTKESVFIPKVNDLLISGIVVNDKVLYGNDYLIEKVGNLYFKVTYDAFFQVNREMLDIVFNLLKSNILIGTNVLDLFCGTGVLGLSVSSFVNKVYSIELNKHSYLNAIDNAKMNNINNIEFICGDANEEIRNINDNIDVVIVDPPRSGLSKVGISLLKKIKAKRIIYLSCNPITLKRDIDNLDIYKVINVVGLDFFCYTYHVETFCILDLK